MIGRRLFLTGLLCGLGARLALAIGPDQQYVVDPNETSEVIKPDDADWFASLMPRSQQRRPKMVST